MNETPNPPPAVRFVDDTTIIDQIPNYAETPYWEEIINLAESVELMDILLKGALTLVHGVKHQKEGKRVGVLLCFVVDFACLYREQTVH